MGANQILGGAMLTLFVFCLFFYTARGMGLGVRHRCYSLCSNRLRTTYCQIGEIQPWANSYSPGAPEKV